MSELSKQAKTYLELLGLSKKAGKKFELGYGNEPDSIPERNMEKWRQAHRDFENSKWVPLEVAEKAIQEALNELNVQMATIVENHKEELEKVLKHSNECLREKDKLLKMRTKECDDMEEMANDIGKELGELKGKVEAIAKIALNGFEEAEHLHYGDALWTYKAILEKLGVHVSTDPYGEPYLTEEDKKKFVEVFQLPKSEGKQE